MFPPSCSFCKTKTAELCAKILLFLFKKPLTAWVLARQERARQELKQRLMSRAQTLTPTLPADAPVAAQIFRHKKTLRDYSVIASGFLEKDLTPVVIYTDGTTVWVRPLTEFMDGRFVAVKEYQKGLDNPDTKNDPKD